MDVRRLEDRGRRKIVSKTNRKLSMAGAQQAHLLVSGKRRA